MIRIGGIRVHMPEQRVEQRIHNFDSVPLGYDEDEVVAEAQRCIMCQNAPCESLCPARMEIRRIIREIAFGNYREAYLIAKKDNPIPAISGRVCPQEVQCEGVCPLAQSGNGINIGKLEAFIADWAMTHGIKETVEIKDRTGKVAIVGSGPASISCAVDLRKLGYSVVMFEALHMAGGVLQYGIPAFRLPRTILDYEIAYLDEIGVEVRRNEIIGQNMTFQELREMYDAIFLGTGAGAPRFMGIEGERLKGVYSANEFLIRINLMKAYKFPEYDTPIVCGKKVGVIGAGNVTMDAARCAVRLGAEEVHVLYRRTKKESPARDEEIQHALEEGVVFHELVNPIRILSNKHGWVMGIELLRMELGEPDSSGRPRPVPVEGSEFTMAFDTVVEAIGNEPNRLFLDRTPELETTKWGTIKVDSALMTNIEGVYAGGDAIRGGATVILALGDGRVAAKSMDEYLVRRSRNK
ncbi:MAG: NADPH-dependent glutamate synthase [bacterium]